MTAATDAGGMVRDMALRRLASQAYLKRVALLLLLLAAAVAPSALGAGASGCKPQTTLHTCHTLQLPPEAYAAS